MLVLDVEMAELYRVGLPGLTFTSKHKVFLADEKILNDSWKLLNDDLISISQT